MLNVLFPITDNWSWSTFALYVSSSLCVCFLCKEGALLNARLNKKIFNFYYVLSFVILVLLASLRSDSVGPDTATYVKRFLEIHQFSFDYSQMISFHGLEPGFSLLLLLVRSFTDNYTVLFFIVYSIVAYAYISFIKFFFDEKSEYLFLFIFIFFFVNNMSGMRSAIGQSFLLFSFIFLARKKIRYSVIFTLIASTFHYTMLFNLYVILFIALLMDMKMIQKKRSLIIAAVVLLVFAFTNIYVLNMLLANTKYSYYSVNDASNLSLFGSMFFVLFGLVSILYMKQIVQKSSKFKILFYISWAFLLAYPILFVTGAYRIPNYYVMPRLFIWSECFRQYQNIQGRGAYNTNFFLKLVLFLLLVGFLLLRFTKSSLDGNFVYCLK